MPPSRRCLSCSSRASLYHKTTCAEASLSSRLSFCCAGVPIPEEQAAAGQDMEDATQQALTERQQQGI